MDRGKDKPVIKKGEPLGNIPKVVSLFSGAGGLDFGFIRAGFQIPIALDIMSAAIRTHKRNFKKTESIPADLLKLGPKGIVKLVTKQILKGETIGVIGGPPCQGFSRANVQSSPSDPRNSLTSLYLDVISELQKTFTIDFAVFENVPGIRDRKHFEFYTSIIRKLSSFGFEVSEHELCALDFGIPQKRRRVVLSAIREGSIYAKVQPRKRKGHTTVKDAIGCLPEPVFFERNLNPFEFPVHPNHWTMQPKSHRFNNPSKFQSGGRSFRKLSWDKPSPTIAFGHREIHVHPNGKRRLSIYEAMLLQGFPDNFVLEGTLSDQVQQISNAVPPPLAYSMAKAIKRSLGCKN